MEATWGQKLGSPPVEGWFQLAQNNLLQPKYSFCTKETHPRRETLGGGRNKSSSGSEAEVSSWVPVLPQTGLLHTVLDWTILRASWPRGFSHSIHTQLHLLQEALTSTSMDPSPSKPPLVIRDLIICSDSVKHLGLY